MSEAIKIRTDKYLKEGYVDVDGNIWQMKMPGSATETRLSQIFRSTKVYEARIKMLEKKIDSEKATIQELDDYERYAEKMTEAENEVISFFSSIFKDNTEDNSDVKNWIAKTPMSIIQKSFDDIQEQVNKVPEVTDGQTEPTRST